MQNGKWTYAKTGGIEIYAGSALTRAIEMNHNAEYTHLTHLDNSKQK